MEYVNFGKAGIKVSRLALGLGFRGQADEAQAQRTIEHAIDQGINLIDCANVYGPLDRRESAGRSEVILGKALKGIRDAVVITSKVASPVGDGPNDRGLSRVHIIREVERSLTRLNTDYIDVYLAHVFDEFTPLEETVRALDDLVRSGKVRYAGCCNFTAWQVCKALWIADRINAAPFICVQNPYHLLNPGSGAGDVRTGPGPGVGSHGLQPAGHRAPQRNLFAGPPSSFRVPLGDGGIPGTVLRSHAGAFRRGRFDRHRTRERTRQDAGATGHRLGAVTFRSDRGHHRRRHDRPSGRQPGFGRLDAGRFGAAETKCGFSLEKRRPPLSRRLAPIRRISSKKQDEESIKQQVLRPTSLQPCS